MSDGPAAADHLSLDELAELEEGIAANADALRRHLDECPPCRERAGQLHASRALLSSLPPEPMPADVAARIDAALAAEAAPPARGGAGGTIVPMRPRRSWLRGPNVAAAAAGVAVLALGAALVVGHVGQKSTPAAKDATSGVQGARPLGAAASPTGLKQFQTGHNYTAATRGGYVTGLMLTVPPPFPTPIASPQTPLSTGPQHGTAPASYTRDQLRDPAAVYACAALLESRPVSPIAIDYATYDTVPADILVLPGRSDPAGELDVYVIRSTCSDSATDISFFRVQRPPGR